MEETDQMSWGENRTKELGLEETGDSGMFEGMRQKALGLEDGSHWSLCPLKNAS